MKKATIGVTLLLVMVLSIPFEVLAQQRGGVQRTGRLFVGTEVGVQAGTADKSTAFAFGFNGDYYLDEHFTVGPLLQFGFTGDLTQVGLSAQAKYIFDLPRIPAVKPHLQGGLGFLHVDIDRSGTSSSDLGFLVPFGGGFELEVSKNLLVGTTLLLNFTDADVDGEREGNVFMTWFLGLRLTI